MATYETGEALRILANHRARKYPQLYAEKRQAAATGLVEAVIEVAKAAGLRTGKDPKDSAYIVAASPHTSGGIWLVGDADGVHIGITQFGQQQRLEDPVITYDAGTDRWLTSLADTFLAPVPGEPVRARSAVAAVADRIVEALDKIS